jgi:hypothetical protein
MLLKKEWLVSALVTLLVMLRASGAFSMPKFRLNSKGGGIDALISTS